MSDVYVSFSCESFANQYLLQGFYFKTMGIVSRGGIYYYWRESIHFTEALREILIPNLR